LKGSNHFRREEINPNNVTTPFLQVETKKRRGSGGKMNLSSEQKRNPLIEAGAPTSGGCSWHGMRKVIFSNICRKLKKGGGGSRDANLEK